MAHPDPCQFGNHDLLAVVLGCRSGDAGWGNQSCRLFSGPTTRTSLSSVKPSYWTCGKCSGNSSWDTLSLLSPTWFGMWSLLPCLVISFWNPPAWIPVPSCLPPVSRARPLGWSRRRSKRQSSLIKAHRDTPQLVVCQPFPTLFSGTAHPNLPVSWTWLKPFVSCSSVSRGWGGCALGAS